MKSLCVGLVVLAFVAGSLLLGVKPSPPVVQTVPVPGFGSSAPVEPLPPEKRGGPVDYKPIAEALAAENAALEEALRLKDKQLDAMAGQIEALKALVGDAVPL